MRHSNNKYFWEKKRLSDFLDFLQKLVFAIGIPLSIYTYYDANKKEREDHQFFIYDNMDKKYWEYEILASKYPQLGLSDATISDTVLKKIIKPDSLWTNEEKIIGRQMMFLLISMYERAFIMYSNGETDFRKKQWAGWSSGIDRWLTNKNFTNAWNHIGCDFDSDFQKFVNKEIAEANTKLHNSNSSLQ